MLNQNQKEEEKRKQKNNIIDFNVAKSVITSNKKVHKEQEVIEQPIGSKTLTPEEMMEEVEEAFIMGKQEAVYQTVATFLSTPEAVKYNIIGVEIIIENGYINCYWKFGERGVPNGK